jgi:hypothetical protein
MCDTQNSITIGDALSIRKQTHIYMAACVFIENTQIFNVIYMKNINNPHKHLINDTALVLICI